MASSSSAAPMAKIIQSAICRTNVRHRPAPSLFFFPGLSTQPIWPTQLFPSIAQKLQDNYATILEEYKTLKEKQPVSDYSEDQHSKLHTGKWDWHSYILKGQRQSNFAVHCPQTTSILESFDYPRLMSNTPFGFAFFSTMKPLSAIAAHYGPCNLRVRCHFPLIVPSQGNFGIRIADEKVSWKVGEPLFFDDSYEHQVWNETNEERVILLFDLWHPELYLDEIEAIENMFADAKQKGWIKS